MVIFKIKYIISIILLLLLPVVWLNGQNSPYQDGEKVSFIMHYGIITGGAGNLSLTKEILDGKEVYHAYLIGYTTGITDAIFKVRDVYESYFDPVTELPVKSVRDIHEGRYRKYNVVLFDHYSRPDSAILISDLTGKHVTEKGIHDILSCFYYFRKNYLAKNYPFKQDERIVINTWFTDEFYPIILSYKGMENVKTRFGKIRCYKFNPVTEVGRLFKTNEDVSIWFSADKNCLPVKIRFDIFVGAFTAEINYYEGLVEPFKFID
ncbi:MAG TPA: DUF3108 domain-containing protein [Bacteroidales bacterium]|nr:DUF3108 domain-containing protein [Bacteroidales bacterium]HCI55930.1 DUF3108 domain-containing protein [Bacteroidales bacterium]HOU96323.1 DUF3108 domain-containing protein [Bacteroidales bacterium]HQG52154.1 DUF3108 domain-containing protein [Bacteroidales bacterium]HQJ19940.1 DUF3108 domain-containing protein [Bacteroidales bacterium]